MRRRRSSAACEGQDFAGFPYAALVRTTLAPVCFALCALTFAGCGGADTQDESNAAPRSSVGDERPAEIARSTPAVELDATLGDPDAARYIPEGRAIFMRYHLRRIRDTPLAPSLEETFQTSPVARAFIGDSGLSPTRDLDAVLVGAPTLSWRGLGAAAGQWVFVLRHHLDEEPARERLSRIDAQSPLLFREHQGRVSAALPTTTLHQPHLMVLTRPHEAVVLPEAELPRGIAVAADHDARDPSRARAMDPDFVSPVTELMMIEATRLPRFPGLPEHGRARVEVHLAPASEAGGEPRVRLLGSLVCETEQAAIDAEPAVRALAAILGGGSEQVSRSGATITGELVVPMAQAVVLVDGVLSQARAAARP